MRKPISEGRQGVESNGIAVIVFAHKTTDAWEAVLSALVKAGRIVTASWPINTERAVRNRAQKSAALQSSIHLVCRPRENPDGSIRHDEIGYWRDVLLELPQRIHTWMPRLAEEGIVGADAIFACLGPALEIFSRYSREKKPMALRSLCASTWSRSGRQSPKKHSTWSFRALTPVGLKRMHASPPCGYGPWPQGVRRRRKRSEGGTIHRLFDGVRRRS